MVRLAVSLLLQPEAEFQGGRYSQWRGGLVLGCPPTSRMRLFSTCHRQTHGNVIFSNVGLCVMFSVIKVCLPPNNVSEISVGHTPQKLSQAGFASLKKYEPSLCYGFQRASSRYRVDFMVSWDTSEILDPYLFLLSTSDTGFIYWGESHCFRHSAFWSTKCNLHGAKSAHFSNIKECRQAAKLTYSRDQNREGCSRPCWKLSTWWSTMPNMMKVWCDRPEVFYKTCQGLFAERLWAPVGVARFRSLPFRQPRRYTAIINNLLTWALVFFFWYFGGSVYLHISRVTVWYSYHCGVICVCSLQPHEQNHGFLL